MYIYADLMPTSNSPKKIGRNSLKVMCWISAMTILRLSWYRRSSSQLGLISCNRSAILLCSRIQIVCIAANCGCSLTRPSPVWIYCQFNVEFPFGTGSKFAVNEPASNRFFTTKPVQSRHKIIMRHLLWNKTAACRNPSTANHLFGSARGDCYCGVIVAGVDLRWVPGDPWR